MDAHKKIKRFIERLNRTIFHSLKAYYLWKHLFLSRDTNSQTEKDLENKLKIQNRFKYFFIQTEEANLHCFCLGISRFFDGHESAISIIKAKNCAQAERKKLNAEAFVSNNPDRKYIENLSKNYKGITNNDIKIIEDLIEEKSKNIARFKKIRNKIIAHEDINEIEFTLPPLQEIEELFESMINMVNKLRYGLEHSTTAYNHVEELVTHDLNLIYEELTKNKKK